MPDNDLVDNGVLTDIPVATRKVTYSGDAGQNVQAVGLIGFSGADDAKTATDIADATGVWVQGGTAHDAVDAGNPAKIGGKANSSAPTMVAAGDRVDAWFDLWGRPVVSDLDPEWGYSGGMTGLRDRLVAERYTVLADSIADGISSFWTSTTASGGTTTSTGGEGVIDTSANATGSAQLTSTTVPYHPGQVSWLNSALRFNDTGSAGNIRRFGVFTVSGTTPQEGFAFELSGTTLNATVYKAAAATAVASTSWSRVIPAPFTLDTNYHSFEIRWTANSVNFLVDNVLRHTVSGTTSPITTTLNFPMTIQSINTSGATSRLIAVRNCGIGRFGQKPDLGTAAGTQVTVTNTSTTLIAAANGQRQVTLVNNQTVSVWVDPNGGTAATATHFRLEPYASMTVTTRTAITAITSAAYSASGDAKVHVLASTVTV